MDLWSLEKWQWWTDRSGNIIYSPSKQVESVVWQTTNDYRHWSLFIATSEFHCSCSGSNAVVLQQKKKSFPAKLLFNLLIRHGTVPPWLVLSLWMLWTIGPVAYWTVLAVVRLPSGFMDSGRCMDTASHGGAPSVTGGFHDVSTTLCPGGIWDNNCGHTLCMADTVRVREHMLVMCIYSVLTRPFSIDMRSCEEKRLIPNRPKIMTICDVRKHDCNISNIRGKQWLRYHFRSSSPFQFFFLWTSPPIGCSWTQTPIGRQIVCLETPPTLHNNRNYPPSLSLRLCLRGGEQPFVFQLFLGAWLICFSFSWNMYFREGFHSE